jgi:hypothetical protein
LRSEHQRVTNSRRWREASLKTQRWQTEKFRFHAVPLPPLNRRVSMRAKNAEEFERFLSISTAIAISIDAVRCNLHNLSDLTLIVRSVLATANQSENGQRREQQTRSLPKLPRNPSDRLAAFSNENIVHDTNDDDRRSLFYLRLIR